MPATSFERVALLLVSVLGAAACGLQERVAPPRHTPAALLVENRSARDVVVYLADGHAPLRLGRVAGLTRARLSVPAHATRPGAQLLVRSTGSVDVYIDEQVPFGASGTVELTVHPLLTQSTLDVLGR